MRTATRIPMLGKHTLHIEGRIVAAFDTEDELDAAPEAIAARAAGRQVLVYGPAGDIA